MEITPENDTVFSVDAVNPFSIIDIVKLGANMSATSHLTHPRSELTRLIINKFYLRNKPNLHIILLFLFQGEQLDEIHSVE